MPPSPQFKRGARPSPRHKLLAADPWRVLAAPPSQVAYVPQRLSMWGNQAHGMCVTSEELFAKACYLPEIFIDEPTGIAWAQRHGVLEGASLIEVLEWMRGDGFVAGGQTYNDGAHFGVNYADETVLWLAIATGPVKIAIDADALPPGAGSQMGWWSVDGVRHPNTDHCVSICGYGHADFLYQQMGAPLPIAPDLFGYLIYTWNTIGFVTFPWILGTCVEAWVRNPTTVGVPPLAPPAPPGPTPASPTEADVLTAADRVVVNALNHARPVCRSTLTALRQDVHAALAKLYVARGELGAATQLDQIALGLQIARGGIQAMRDRLEYALTDKP